MKFNSQDWEKLRRKPVAILGAGVSGRGVGALLDRIEWEYETYDEQGRAFGTTEARSCSLVVFSPGFTLDHEWLELARSNNLPLVGEVDFGSYFLSNKITAVTGTNGKTSLVKMLEQVWNFCGRKAVAAGNVGLSLCELVARGVEPETEVFLEVSSFQSQSLSNLCPESVLWTNFEDDHLDHHKNREEYFSAKARLLERVPPKGTWVGRSVLEKAAKVGYVLPADTVTVDRTAQASPGLPADHFLQSYPQRENIAIAKAFCKSRGINEGSFDRAVLSCAPSAHRLQKVATVGKATFWNDSKATNASAAVAACLNFSGSLFWIGGGRSKGEDSSMLPRLLKPMVNRAFLIGEMGGCLLELFRQQGILSDFCASLGEAVKGAFEEVTEATNILFSPGFASFDGYSNFEERGKSFVDSVFDLKKLASATTQESIN